jgi:alkylhydroperoxidase family enzyme
MIDCSIRGIHSLKEINMSTTRIVPLEAPYEDSIAETFNRLLPGMEPLKLFRTQAHNPRVLQRMFAGNLLDKGSIDLRARELVILRTCVRCGSEYEWGVHVAFFSERAKLSSADVAMTLTNQQEQITLPVQETLLLKVVDELHDTSTVSDALWNELVQHYSSAQILEIIALTGYYHTISFITNAARVELETFAPRFV